MPLPALIGPAAFGGPAAAAAAKASLCTAAEYLPAVSSASLSLVLARIAWNRVPQWIRDDVAFRRSTQDWEQQNNDDNMGEMERLSSVIEKLQALVEVGSEKLGTPVDFLFASLLIYFQLAAQHKILNPEVRDDMYHESGTSDISLEELQKLKVMLEFAILAYYVEDEQHLLKHLDPAGYSLLHRSVATRPGTVGYFVAVFEEQKTLMIGLKGTSSLEDFFTDSCGRSVSYNPSEGLQEEFNSRIEVRARIDDQVLDTVVGDLAIEVISGHERIVYESGDDDEEHHIRTHEGIFLSARRVADSVHSTVARLVIEKGYKLCMVGHSLGGGAGALLSMILRSRFRELSDDNMEVYAFAPPPVLDHDAAVASAPYITSVVNNADIIPRSSLVNLAVFLEFLRSVSKRLQEKGLAPKGPKSTAAFLHKLAMGAKGEPLMTIQELTAAMSEAHNEVELRHPDHLYIPGRVLLLHEDWKIPSVAKNEEAAVTPNVCCTTTDGTIDVLRLFEVDGYRTLGDHTTASYTAILDALLRQGMDKQR